MRRLAVSAIIVLFAVSIAFAQKTKKASGSYIYVVPETQSMIEAQETAISRAKLEIIANTFGTILDMSATTAIKGDGSQYHALSQSQVKGEWLETVGEPVITRLYDGQQMAIKVEITGRVREIVTASSEFSAKVLQVPDSRYEQNSFQNGDSFFLSFQAPGDGFVTVYLYDGKNGVYRLLPYPNQSIGAFPVKGGKQYFFFSPDHTDGVSAYNDITEYSLQASSDLELNRLYIIYSPNSYNKAMDTEMDDGLRELHFDSFQKWLSRIRSEDVSIGVKMIDITIAK